MEIGVPTFKPSEKTYIFPFLQSSFILSSEPKYLEGLDFPDAVAVEEPESKEVVTQLLEAFIEKTKQHFATPLRTKVLLSRLNHIWQGPTPPVAVDQPGWYSVQWHPKELRIMPKDFALVWQAGQLQSTSPLIPSEFVEGDESRSPSPAPELRTIHLQQTIPAGLVEFEPPYSDPTESRLMTLDYEAPAHTIEKKRIREAKLRAALAALKAERLAEKYYQKYGSLPGDDSSDLTSDSEVEES